MPTSDPASYLPGAAPAAPAAAPPPVVEPLNPAAAPPTAEPAAAAAPTSKDAKKAAGALPAELIQIPAIQGVLTGEPPAFSASIEAFSARPEGKLIQQNAQPLMDAGIGLYRSLGGDIGVLFNRMYVADSEIQEADKAGTLAQLAPPFDEVNMALGKAGPNNPVMRKDRQAPTGFKQGGAKTPTPGPVTPSSAAGVPKSSQRTITSKQRNTMPGSPTSGPKPGAGRLMNDILKPVV